MNKRFDAVDFNQLRKRFAQPIFNGFDIMIGGGLNGFNTFGISGRKSDYPDTQFVDGCGRERHTLADARLEGQRNQPLHLNVNTKFNQCIFAKKFTKCGNFFRIPAIQWAECCDWRKRVGRLGVKRKHVSLLCWATKCCPDTAWCMVSVAK